MYKLNQKLHERYLAIIENSLDFKAIKNADHKELSELFLSGISENYENSVNKIMVIGRETRGWKRHASEDCTFSEYINGQTVKASEYLQGRKERQKNERGSTFHNFVKGISGIDDQVGVVWSNLYCFSWKKGSCENSPVIKHIKNLSHELLDAQINTLRPQYIVLAHGVNSHSIKLRQIIFPDDSRRNTLKIHEFIQVPDKYLCAFDFDYSANYKVRCFRIHHPSSTANFSRVARKKLIEYLSIKST